ncbi:CinA-like protein [Trichinella spiralis]|uniref:CinA-like protein n=1 Tax=Trichinella spiralis TaxID=6334 RepID=A0ABR3KAT0_TRISP
MANGSDPILSCSLNNNELMQCLNQLQIADNYSTNSTFRTEVFLNRLFMRGGLRSYLKQKVVRFQHRYSPYHVPLRNEQCELLEDLHGKQVFDRIKAHVASEFQKIHILGPKKYDMSENCHGRVSTWFLFSNELCENCSAFIIAASGRMNKFTVSVSNVTIKLEIFMK